MFGKKKTAPKTLTELRAEWDAAKAAAELAAQAKEAVEHQHPMGQFGWLTSAQVVTKLEAELELVHAHGRERAAVRALQYAMEATEIHSVLAEQAAVARSELQKAAELEAQFKAATGRAVLAYRTAKLHYQDANVRCREANGGVGYLGFPEPIAGGTLGEVLDCVEARLAGPPPTTPLGDRAANLPGEIRAAKVRAEEDARKEDEERKRIEAEKRYRAQQEAALPALYAAAAAKAHELAEASERRVRELAEAFDKRRSSAGLITSPTSPDGAPSRIERKPL